jgi:serine/threonine-protein kinase
MPNSGEILVNRYVLLDRVGAGAAAEVWRATDRRLGRTVAIKILRPQYVSDPEARTRFEREARAAAGLSHPNVVDVYDYGAADDTVFIAMQYVDGEDLKRTIAARERLPGPDAARIALAVCQGLESAHAHGLIHRDIKPQNILIDRNGTVRITDFGVAKALSGPDLTQTGMTYGTAAYLSPEQATGQPVGPASDVYALGVVLYEMLCGQPPFQGENAAAVAYQQVYQAPPPVRACAPDVPDALAAVVDRALEKNPALRYPTAAALAAALDTYLAGVPHLSPPGTTVPAPLYSPAPLSPGLAVAPASPPPPIVPDQPTASLAAAPLLTPTRTQPGGFAPWLAVPLVGLLLLACGLGALQTGLLNINLGAATGSPTPAPTRVAGAGAEPTLTPAGVATAAPEPPTATAPPPAPPTATAPPPASPPGAQGTKGNPVFPTPTVPVAASRAVTLEDVAFVGAYRYQPPSNYEGRTAAWIYAPGTGFERMAAVFDIAGQPGGTAGLTLSGMDSEDKASTPMRILINDQPIFDGPNPLPNDFSPNAGSWGLFTWTFDAALLHPGRNTLTIENHAPSGKIGAPPFIMVDFARLEWESER